MLRYPKKEKVKSDEQIELEEGCRRFTQVFIFFCCLASLILSIKLMNKHQPVQETRQQVNSLKHEMEMDVMHWNTEYSKQFKQIQIKVIKDSDLYFDLKDQIT